MTSPGQEGFQIWHDFPEQGGDPILNHIRNEIWGIRSANHIRKETKGALLADPGRLQRIKKMVRDEFGSIFGECECCTGKFAVPNIKRGTCPYHIAKDF